MYQSFKPLLYLWVISGIHKYRNKYIQKNIDNSVKFENMYCNDFKSQSLLYSYEGMCLTKNIHFF